MKVTTKDFQSLKGENTFEFPVGITIIQGKTDSGKSTVFYAIQDCLENPSGVSDVINWDAKSAEVTIENDGGYVKWIKTASSSEYVDKNGKPYVKASKLDSRNIDNLGFYFDKKDKVINIHNEWDKIFPFESSDTEMFKLFEDMFNISSSFQIIDAIKKDEQEVKNKTSQIKNKIDCLHQQNLNIDNILSNVNINQVNEIISDLQYKANAIVELTKDYANLSDNQKYLTLQIPEELDTSILIKNNSYYNQLKEDYNNYLINMEWMNMNIPEWKNFELVENKYENDYNRYISILDQIKNYDNEIVKLNEQENLVTEKLKEIKVCPTCGHKLEV